MLLIMTVTMFVVGTAHSATSLWQTWSSIHIAQGEVVREDVHLSSYEYAKLALEVVNVRLTVSGDTSWFNMLALTVLHGRSDHDINCTHN